MGRGDPAWSPRGGREITAELSTILADLRRHLEALYGPRLVRLVLFGSQARAEA
jgi:hypothetical protein